MRIQNTSKLWLFASAVCVALATSGCGNSAPESKVPVQRGIFTSAADCAASQKFPMEKCTKAIEAAIENHVATAPTYTSLKSCEKAEGAEKCERMDEKTYRPKLRAFLVVGNEEVLGSPLYPTTDGAAGFRGLDKVVYSADDETLNFSPQAVAAYELHSGKVVAKSKYNF